LLGRALRLLPTAIVIVVAIGPHRNRRTGQHKCQGRHGAQQAMDHHKGFSLSFSVYSTWVRSSVDRVTAPFETSGHGATVTAGLLLDAGGALRRAPVVVFLHTLDLFLPRGVRGGADYCASDGADHSTLGASTRW
jgi:hypothetical protein